jgi:hypothetical protein
MEKQQFKKSADVKCSKTRKRHAKHSKNVKQTFSNQERERKRDINQPSRLVAMV